MPKSKRDTAKRDLDAAINNINWSDDKLLNIGMDLIKSVEYYEENEIPTPEQNSLLLEGVDTAIELSQQVKTIIQFLRDNI